MQYREEYAFIQKKPIVYRFSVITLDQDKVISQLLSPCRENLQPYSGAVGVETKKQLIASESQNYSLLLQFTCVPIAD